MSICFSTDICEWPQSKKVVFQKWGPEVSSTYRRWVMTKNLIFALLSMVNYFIMMKCQLLYLFTLTTLWSPDYIFFWLHYINRWSCWPLSRVRRHFWQSSFLNSPAAISTARWHQSRHTTWRTFRSPDWHCYDVIGDVRQLVTWVMRSGYLTTDIKLNLIEPI